MKAEETFPSGGRWQRKLTDEGQTATRRRQLQKIPSHESGGIFLLVL